MVPTLLLRITAPRRKDYSLSRWWFFWFNWCEPLCAERLPCHIHCRVFSDEVVDKGAHLVAIQYSSTGSCSLWHTLSVSQLCTCPSSPLHVPVSLGDTPQELTAFSFPPLHSVLSLMIQGAFFFPSSWVYVPQVLPLVSFTDIQELLRSFSGVLYWQFPPLPRWSVYTDILIMCWR